MSVVLYISYYNASNTLLHQPLECLEMNAKLPLGPWSQYFNCRQNHNDYLFMRIWMLVWIFLPYNTNKTVPEAMNAVFHKTNIMIYLLTSLISNISVFIIWHTTVPFSKTWLPEQLMHMQQQTNSYPAFPE